MTLFLNEQAQLYLNSKNVLAIQVHGGVFHADDVCVVALFKALNMVNLKVIRDFKIHEEADIVADVGKQYSVDGEQLMFDHHQDLPLRADGTKPSALGLVADWLLTPEVRAKLDRFITPIERLDNGQELRKGEVNYFSFVATFNSNWNEGIDQDYQFFQAVEMAINVWQRIFASIEAEAEATEIVAEAIANAENGFAVLSKGGMPWQSSVVKYNATHEEKILRVGYMDLARGQFNVQAVPDKLGSKGMLQALPEQWLGEDKPEGLIFCHQARFLAAFSDEESARKALAAEA
ncbi:MAG: MYG1 family protein [Succinivibrio sp.]|nr:MYG1 family protein [Succinivibrio sp.]